MKDLIPNSRRNFIKTAAVGTVATLSIPQIVLAAETGFFGKKIRLNDNDIILFQGDSITDWGRDHKATEPNTTSMLGSGYAILAAAELLMKHPEKNLKIYNRGVSGNKVYQLAERWDADCIAIKPNVLSIHIGVNDYWHTLNNKYKGTVENYYTDYKALIERTQKALPDVKIVICEPFALRGNKAVTDAWYPAFDTYRKAANDVADQYNLPFVAYQEAFDKALQHGGDSNYWTIDGVHPSVAGEKLMAHAWLEAVKG